MSLGHKEKVTVAQVKQYCEMESHEERLYKMVMQSKINGTKDIMKRKASEIDKSKIEKNRGDKGGFMSLQSMGSASGFGSGSGFRLSTDIDSLTSKSKEETWPNQFLESLKAEGEVILEDVQPKLGQSKPAAPLLIDPITLTVEQKLKCDTETRWWNE